MNLLSAFGGGLWIIPLVLILGSLWSFYRAFKQWRSGSAWWGSEDGVAKTMESEERVPFFSIGASVFGVILLAAFILVVIIMISEK